MTVVAVAAAALTAAASSAAVSAASDLRAPTGTATQHRTGTGSATLVGIRVGQHRDYDRLVLDLTGALPGWTVGYVGEVTQDGSGRPVPLRGPAVLQVTLRGTQAHDDSGAPTVRPPAALTPELPTLRQVKPAGDFEGIVTYGMGLRDRVGFRVLGLTNPTRVVIDVAHQPRQPFGSAPVISTGTASEVVITGVRAGRHPGYDRAVFDVAGPARPSLRVTQGPSGSYLEVTISAPRVAYSGRSPISFDLPAIRGVELSSAGAGTATFRLTTAAQHRFRVMQLSDPTRIAVDVAH